MKTEPSNTRPGQLPILAGLTRYVLKSTLRNRPAYFFSLVFPLVFVIVFGLFSTPRPLLQLGVPDTMAADHPLLRALAPLIEAENPPLALVRGSEAELRRRLGERALTGLLLPGESPSETGGVTLLTSDSSPQAGLLLESVIQGALGEARRAAAGMRGEDPGLRRETLPGRPMRHFDFILPGQLGFSMLSLATFGIGYHLAALRKMLVLKRMFATAVKPLTFVVAQGLSRSGQAVLQSAVILAVGVVLFQFNLAHGWRTVGDMLLLCFLGIMAFLGFGILMTNVFEDEQTLPVALNLFNLPQVLLGGVFFSNEELPAWVRAIGDNLPLSHLNAALRKSALEGLALPDLWPHLLALFAWAALAYLLAARTFKAE